MTRKLCEQIPHQIPGPDYSKNATSAHSESEITNSMWKCFSRESGIEAQFSCLGNGKRSRDPTNQGRNEIRGR